MKKNLHGAKLRKIQIADPGDSKGLPNGIKTSHTFNHLFHQHKMKHLFLFLNLNL